MKWNIFVALNNNIKTLSYDAIENVQSALERILFENIKLSF